MLLNLGTSRRTSANGGAGVARGSPLPHPCFQELSSPQNWTQSHPVQSSFIRIASVTTEVVSQLLIFNANPVSGRQEAKAAAFGEECASAPSASSRSALSVFTSPRMRFLPPLALPFCINPAFKKQKKSTYMCKD